MKKIRCLGLLILLLNQVWIAYPTQAQNQDMVTVVFTPEMSLRMLAEEYLGDPDEWEMLLHYNGLQSLADLRPNTALNIPVALFQRTVQVLQRTEETARAASMEGAGVLAQTSIDEANRLSARAMDLKKKGDLEGAATTAQEALKLAEQALNEARAKKIQAVSAVLDQKDGQVESRKPEQPVWGQTALKQELTEQERVRTLISSLAGILFVDGSQIKLSENSLAVIGAMRENLIKRSFQAEVTVLQGDILAHLSALGGQKEFTIHTPGVETTIRSQKFRTSRDDAQVTRIANYDGEIDVTANQGTVTIKKDEGTKIEQGKQPEAPRKLLMPPAMLSPTPNQVFFSATIVFEWEAQPQANAYQLEISTDRNFTAILKNTRVRGTRYAWQAPQKGVYYYHIYTIDQDEFAGPFSDPFGLYVDLDTVPPYLSVTVPTEGEVFLSPDIVVQGMVEQHTTLMINDVPVTYGANGEFTHRLTVTPGEQILTITATDPAQNRTSIERRIVYNTTAQLITLHMPEHVVSNVNQVTLQGELRPQTKVTINDQPVDLPPQFAYVLTLPEGDQIVTLKGIAPDGHEQTVPVRVTVDLTPPDMTFKDVPAATRDPQFSISGSVTESVTLTCNGMPVAVTEQRFELPVTLQEGEHVFDFNAVDPAGNVTTKTLRTRLDTTPPAITGVACSPVETKGGEIVACTVKAADAGVGLAKTGSFNLLITPGNQVLKGILTLNSAKTLFEGSVFVPAGVTGKIAVQAVRIQDRLKNEASNF